MYSTLILSTSSSDEEDKRSLAQLVVEVGFAGINYGLRKDMQVILAALPDWIEDKEPLASAQAVILFGLGRPKASAKMLEALPQTACIPLRRLL